MFCAIWYYFHNLKNVKNTHRGVLLLVKLQAEAYNFPKSITPPWAVPNRAKLLRQFQTNRVLGTAIRD